MFINNNIYSLTTKDFSNQVHSLTDYYNVTFSKHYGGDGSGFGFLNFSLKRITSRNYSDIGHGYKITLRKGPRTVLFHGRITHIEEGTNDELNISAVGSNTLLQFDLLNVVMADNRVNRWSAGCTPVGSYRPDKFDHSLSWTIVDEFENETSFDGLEIKPRKGMKYNEEDFYYLRYRFEFEEVAKRLVADWAIQLPNAWPGRVTIEDADGNELWTQTTSGNGLLILDLNSSTQGNFVTLKFEVTTTGINTAEDDAVYVRLWDLTISSEELDVTASTVMERIADHMALNYGFSSDKSLIVPQGYIIPQAAYEDRRLNEAAKEACSYGTPGYQTLAWGVAFDATDRIFLEAQPVDEIEYMILEADDYAIVGDLTESYQKVYGKYTDTFGRTQRTDTLVSDDVIDGLGGLYRKEVITLDDVTEDQAEQLLNVALRENDEPKISAEFSVVGNIHNKTGGVVAVEDILPGKIVQVPEFRARESAILDDKRKGTHTFLIKAVEINLDSKTARLIPADNKASFETYMEQIKRLSN